MKRLKPFISMLSGYSVFLLTYTLVALLPHMFGTQVEPFAQIGKLFLACGIIGILLPILTARKWSLPYDQSSTAIKIVMGIILLFAALGIEIAFYSSWVAIITDNPSDLIRIKHVLFTLPLSIALSLQFYYVIPRSVEKSFGTRAAAAVNALVSGISFGIIMFVETGFYRIDLFFVMTGVGVLIGTGLYLTGKFFLTFVALFLAVYANSLAELRYAHYSWPISIAGFIFCIGILLAAFLVHIRNAESDNPITSRERDDATQ